MKFAILKQTPKLLLKAKSFAIAHAPEIMTYGGVAIEVVGVVLACKAAVQMDDILTQGKKEIDDIKEGWETEENRQLLASKGYFEKDYKRELTIQYTKNIARAARPWILPALCLVTGNGLIIGSHIQLQKRNAALVSAYAALDEAYRQYRARVVDKYGKRDDYYFAHGIEEIEETVEIEDPETGKKKKVKQKVLVSGEHPSVYARYFDESCRAWTKDSTANMLFLRCAEAAANEKLHREGYLFLNEVYDALGYPRTTAGQLVGWIDGLGDSCVDFALEEVRNRRFFNGEERSVLLDFNVDGVIVDKI